MSSNFSFLSGAYFLAYYFPRSQGSPDKVSDYILHFKGDKEPNTTKWIALSSREIKKNIKNIDIIVRVLRSTELNATGHSSLDRLGATLAKYTNSKYEKQLLRKIRNTRSLKYLSRDERQEEINGSYKFQKSHIVESYKPTILLIDDIVTSGSTIKEVNRAIKSILPSCKLFFFTIGKTFDSWKDEDANNNSILEEFNKSANEIFKYENTSQINPDHQNEPPPTEPPPSEPDLNNLLEPDLWNPPGPNIVLTENNSWRPARGFKWANNNANDFTVIKIKTDSNILASSETQHSPIRQGQKYSLSEIKLLVELVVEFHSMEYISNRLRRTPSGIKKKIRELAYGNLKNKVTENEYPVQIIINQWRGYNGKDLDSLRILKKTIRPSSSKSIETPKSSSEKGCFIVTATFQNPDHPIVIDFRAFRDNCLLNFSLGQFFIKLYYKYAPFVAHILESSSSLRKLTLFLILKPLHKIVSYWINK